MINTSAAHNQEYGIALFQCNNTNMINTSVAYNHYQGIQLQLCNYVNMINTSAAHNQEFGIGLVQCNNTSMINTSTAHNQEFGIELEQCNNTNMINTSAAYNHLDGIGLLQCNDTSMINTSAAHNQEYGIVLAQCNDTSMINTSAAHNQYVGILLGRCINTSMKDVSLAHGGIFLELCTETRMINIHVSAAYVGKTGLSLMNCTASTILEDSIFFNIRSSSTSVSNTYPSSLPAVITVCNSLLTIKNCNFTKNSLSSVQAMGSTIRVLGKVIFSNNSALSGAALIFERKSKLIICDDSYIIFRNNHASYYGGAILVHTEEMQDTSISLRDIVARNYIFNPVMVSKTECSVHVEGSRLDKRLIFMNNTAGKGGDVLYLRTSSSRL